MYCYRSSLNLGMTVTSFITYLTSFLNISNPGLFLFSFIFVPISITISIIQIGKVYMVCLGFEPGVQMVGRRQNHRAI